MTDIATLERVARAICEELGENPDDCLFGNDATGNYPMICYLHRWEAYTPAARAAIAAIPTPPAA